MAEAYHWSLRERRPRRAGARCRPPATGREPLSLDVRAGGLGGLHGGAGAVERGELVGERHGGRVCEA